MPSEVEFNGKTLKVENIRDRAFADQTQIESIKFGSGYRTIGNFTFEGCTALKVLNIPGAVSSLGGSSFEGCTSLKEVNFLEIADEEQTGDNVLTILDDAFEGCPVTILNVGRNIDFYNIDKEKSMFPNLISYTFGQGVSFIPANIFSGNKRITEFSIPENIAEIHPAAFINCTQLKKVTFPATLIASIGSEAFFNCALESLVLPPGIFYIGERAFAGIPTLSELVIEPSPLPLEFKDVFDTKTNIKRLEIGRNITVRYQCPWPDITEVTLREGLTELNDHVLSGCQNITELILPESLATINCLSLPNLTTLTIPGGVTEIANDAIGLRSLQTLIFEKGDQPIHIGYHTVIPAEGLFNHCHLLSQLYISRDIEYDYYTGFEGTSYDTQLFAPFRNMNHLMTLYVSPEVTKLDPGMFNDDKYSSGTSLTRVALPEGLDVNGTPYDKIIYPRDAVIDNGPVIYSKDYETLYFIDNNYDGVLTLQENLRVVNASAAHGATKLKIKSLPSGLESVGRAAFRACHSLGLTEWECPNTLLSVGEEAFMDAGIRKITVNEGLAEIGSRAFGQPSEVVYKARNAAFIPYQGNNDITLFCSFKTLTIEEGVESLPDWFAAYSSGTVSFPSTLKRVGSHAFYRGGFSSMILPESVEFIGENAFELCRNLKEFSLPTAMTEIKSSVFAKCTSMETIRIPANITKVAYDAFDGCTGVTNIDIEAGPQPLVSTTASFMPLCQSKNLLRVSLGRDYMTSNGQPQLLWKEKAPVSFVIGDKVTALSSATTNQPVKAFWNVGSALPNYKKNIGTLVNYVRTAGVAGGSNEEVYKWLGSMFEDNGIIYVLTSATTAGAIDCSYFPDRLSVTLPETVIGSRGSEVEVDNVMPYTFYGNPYITDVTIKRGGVIGHDVFAQCSALKTVSAEKPITNIENKAFSGCTALENIYMSGGVESIGNSVFENCSSLINLNLNDIVSLGNNVFYNCSALSSFTFPETLTSIGTGIFSGCTSLSHVTYNKNITSLPLQMFMNCSSLKEIRIPSTIDCFDATTFSGCTGVEDIIIEEHKGGSFAFPSPGRNYTLFNDIPFKTLTLHSNLILPQNNPFSGKSSLTKVIIGDEVTAILPGMFTNCQNLKDVTIGKSVREIGDNAFSSCSALETLDFGPSVIKIGARAAANSGLVEVRMGESTANVGAYAFDSAPLKNVYCYAVQPPVCGDNAFKGVDTFNCSLYVPKASVKSYQTTPQWEDFFEINGIDDISSGIILPEADRETTDDVRIVKDANGITLSGCQGQSVEVMTLEGQRIYSSPSSADNITISLANGIYILRIGNRVVKILI